MQDETQGEYNIHNTVVQEKMEKSNIVPSSLNENGEVHLNSNEILVNNSVDFKKALKFGSKYDTIIVGNDIELETIDFNTI